MTEPRTTKVCVRFKSGEHLKLALSYLYANDPQSETHLVSDLEIIINKAAEVPLEKFLRSCKLYKEDKDYLVCDIANVSMLSASEAADIRSGARWRSQGDEKNSNPYETDAESLHRSASELARTLKHI